MRRILYEDLGCWNGGSSLRSANASCDPSVFSGDYFTEKLETKAGWNRPSCDEDWFRGFAQEIEDFVGAIRDGSEPRSGIDLAVECVKVIYAAYQSAETGCRVTLT